MYIATVIHYLIITVTQPEERKKQFQALDYSLTIRLMYAAQMYISTLMAMRFSLHSDGMYGYCERLVHYHRNQLRWVRILFSLVELETSTEQHRSLLLKRSFNELKAQVQKSTLNTDRAMTSQTME